jgi:hypothetical protein
VTPTHLLTQRALDGKDPREFSLKVEIITQDAEGRLWPVRLTLANRPRILANLRREIRAICGPDMPQADIDAEADEVLTTYSMLYASHSRGGPRA